MSRILSSRHEVTHLHRIPFDRALELANQENITEMLYPLFVHNVAAFLYDPTSKARARAVIAPADCHQAGGLNHQYPSDYDIPSFENPIIQSDRPGLNRAHTFPTPPNSGSGCILK